MKAYQTSDRTRVCGGQWVALHSKHPEVDMRKSIGVLRSNVIEVTFVGPELSITIDVCPLMACTPKDTVFR